MLKHIQPDIQNKMAATNIDKTNIDKTNTDKTNTDKTNDEQIDLQDYIEEPWTVINSYFRGECLRKLMNHQIESYNNFVNYQIQKTISMFNPVHIRSDQDFSKEADRYSLEF